MRPETGSRSRRLAATGLASCIACVLAVGCGASTTKVSSSNAASAPIVASKQYVPVSASTPWVVWDKSKCAFVTTANHPKTYTATLRKLAAPITVDQVLADPSVPVYATIGASYVKYGKQANINVKNLSNQFPSTSAPLDVAREITVTKPAAVIEDQELPALYPAVQAIFHQSCTPMIDEFNIPTKQPAPGFEAGYVTSGDALAKGMVTLVRQRKWPASEIWMVLCGAPLLAKGPGTEEQVNSTFAQEVSQSLGIPQSHISPELNCNANPDTARNVTTDWLTAHPQAKYAIAMSWPDFIAVPMVQALQQKGFTSKNALAAGGQANIAPLQLMAKGSILQVDFNKNFPTWGILGLSMAEDIAAGRPVPLTNDPGVTPVVGTAAAASLLAKQYGKKT